MEEGATRMGPALFFVTNLYTYYLYTGDLGFVRQEWPVVEKELAYPRGNTNAQHLIVTSGFRRPQLAFGFSAAWHRDAGRYPFLRRKSASLAPASFGSISENPGKPFCLPA